MTSTATWDIYYFIFFACVFGMTIFTILAAFAFKKSDISGPDDDKEKYIDEEREPGLSGDISHTPEPRA